MTITLCAPTPAQRHAAMIADAASRREARRKAHERANAQRRAEALRPRFEKALQRHLDATDAGIVLTPGSGDVWLAFEEFIASGMRGDEHVCVGCFIRDDGNLDLGDPRDITVFEGFPPEEEPRLAA